MMVGRVDDDGGNQNRAHVHLVGMNNVEGEVRRIALNRTPASANLE